MGLPVLLILGADVAEGAEGANALVAGLAAGAFGLLKLKLAPPILAEALNPLPKDGEGVGVLGAGDPLLAASNALALRSLSPPASIIPDSVPVKKVAIGMISSKNF